MSRACDPLPSIRDPEVDPCRRPIESHELDQLRKLGRAVRALRFDGGQLVVSSGRFAFAAQLNQNSLLRIETGIRRTRRATLQRLANGAARLNPSAGAHDEIFARLIEAAGDALAPASKYQFRVDRRRLRRCRRGAAHAVIGEPKLPNTAQEMAHA